MPELFLVKNFDVYCSHSEHSYHNELFERGFYLMKQNIYDNEEFFSFYKALRETDNNYNILLEQPAMKELLPDLTGKNVLDLGCGFGNNCIDFINLGAKSVTGVDISKNMLNEAIKNNSHPKINYINMPLEDLEKLNQKYDFVYSSLCFHYIKEFDKLIKDIYSLLASDGVLLFSQEHPFVTASDESAGCYIKDAENIPCSFCFNGYQSEGLRDGHWFVDNVIEYHRTFSTIINTLSNNNFIISKIVEPVPNEYALSKRPGLSKEFIKPTFLIVKAVKP